MSKRQIVGMVRSIEATAVASNTRGAYSYDSYKAGEWRKCALMLLKRGFSEAQVGCILQSKWMRLAGDHSAAEHGAYTAADLKRYLAKYTKPRDYISLFRECGVQIASPAAW